MNRTQSKKISLPDNNPQTELRRTGARRTVLLSGLIAGVLALSSNSPSLLPRLCIWYRLTGMDCPFCGLTRSVIATGDLRLSKAVELHPLGPLVLVALAGWLAVSVLRWRTGGPDAMPHRVQKILWIVIGVAWLAWWVAVRIVGL